MNEKENKFFQEECFFADLFYTFIASKLKGMRLELWAGSMLFLNVVHIYDLSF
ncbi:MAG: hypothetical protein WKG06_35570 [Segetibacter sp.]